MSVLSRFRFFPKSLYGQILLVAALALLFAQGVNAALLLASTRNRAVAETTIMVVTRVANQLERQQERASEEGDVARDIVREGPRRRRGGPVIIESMDRPTVIPRYEFQDELTDRAGEFLALSNLGLSQIRVTSGSVRLLPEELRGPLVRRYLMTRMRQNNPQLPRIAILLTARTADGQYLNATALVRPNETGSLIALIVQTILLYIAVLIPLALVARRIARPLSGLTDRVRLVGLADDAEPMKSEGPVDIRQLIETFNIMQTRVATLLGEKDVMLGAIGHDLKTPLAALRVRVESVEDDSEREKMAATIDEMVIMLDDILMLARLGRSGEPVQAVDIGALAESVASEFPAAEFSPPDQRLVAKVRPVLLRRAVRNLIQNAVIYGTRAQISVSQSGSHTIIDVADEGPGIAPSAMEDIFEPFARADASRNRATGGSGLGLTIARAIARSHGGDVSLENQATGGLRASLSIATTR